MAVGHLKVKQNLCWGYSLGFRISWEGVERLGLEEGGSVNVPVNGDTITIRRAKRRKKWTRSSCSGVMLICGPGSDPDCRGRNFAEKKRGIRLNEVSRTCRSVAMALGGKAFVTLTGNVAAVQSASGRGRTGGGPEGHAGRVVIPYPRPELLNEMI